MLLVQLRQRPVVLLDELAEPGRHVVGPREEEILEDGAYRARLSGRYRPAGDPAGAAGMGQAR